MEEKKITDSIHNELTSGNVADILLIFGVLITIFSAMANFPIPNPATTSSSLMGIAMILAAMALYIRGKNSTEHSSKRIREISTLISL